MRFIVTDPATDYFSVDNFGGLAAILDRLIAQACRTISPSRGPCIPRPTTPTPTLPFCEDDVTQATQTPGGKLLHRITQKLAMRRNKTTALYAVCFVNFYFCRSFAPSLRHSCLPAHWNTKLVIIGDPIGSPYIVTIWNVVFANKSRKLGWIWMKLDRWG